MVLAAIQILRLNSIRVGKLLLQIHVFRVVDRTTQEPRPEPAKLFHRISGKKLEPRRFSTLFFARIRQTAATKQVSDYLCGGFRRIHNRDIRRGHAPQYLLDERVMRATENEHIGGLKTIAKYFIEIDLRHLLS